MTMATGSKRANSSRTSPAHAPAASSAVVEPTRAPAPAAPAGRDDLFDALPRTDVDLEAELEGLRDWVKAHTTLGGYSLFINLEDYEGRVEQIIGMLPKEVRRARRICKEEQRIVQDAKDEARRLLEEARAEAEQILQASRQDADRLVESSAIRQRALEQSEAMLADAQQTAREIREKSYVYSQEVIGNVVESLKRLTASVEQDRTQLEEMRPEGE